jgi:hypothetical protein
MTYLGLHQSSNQRVDQTRLQSFGLSGPGCSSPFNKPSGLSVEVLANPFHRFLSAQSRLLPTSSTSLICHSRGSCQPLPQIPVCIVEVIANLFNKPSDLSQSMLLPTPSLCAHASAPPCDETHHALYLLYYANSLHVITDL